MQELLLSLFPWLQVMCGVHVHQVERKKDCKPSSGNANEETNGMEVEAASELRLIVN